MFSRGKRDHVLGQGRSKCGRLRREYFVSAVPAVHQQSAGAPIATRGARVVRRQRARVLLAAQLLQRVEDWPEDVGLVVRDDAREIGKPRVFWMMPVTRSKPMPVSTLLAGSGENVPSGLALNCMKTRFQISMHWAEPWFTSAPRVSPAGVRSTCSSEHGPHGRCRPSSRNYPSCRQGRCGPWGRARQR